MKRSHVEQLANEFTTGASVAQFGVMAQSDGTTLSINAALELEIKIVADAIIERDKQSNQIKQWCITLWMASWAVMAFDVGSVLENSMFAHLAIDAPELYLISVSMAAGSLCVMFFILDTINKRNQYKFLWRGRVIHQHLNNRLEGGEFLVYDPGGASDKGGSRRLKFGTDLLTYDEFVATPHVIHQVSGLKLFYGVLAALSLIPTVVVLVI